MIVDMATRKQEHILHMEHKLVTMIIPQKLRCDSLIPIVLYKTDIRYHGGESYKFGSEEEVTEGKNGINTGKTGLCPGLLALLYIVVCFYIWLYFFIRGCMFYTWLYVLYMVVCLLYSAIGKSMCT
jgi:hypothetical protein